MCGVDGGDNDGEGEVRVWVWVCWLVRAQDGIGHVCGCVSVWVLVGAAQDGTDQVCGCGCMCVGV
jgi:hypothetical protein